MSKLTVVIPCYNEAATVAEVLRRVRGACYPGDKEVVVVDDGSGDGTEALLRGPLASYINRLIVHRVNRGKGAAIRSGLEAATGDLIVVQDADLEYDPNQYAKLAAPILSGDADVVYGSRFLDFPSGKRVHEWPRHRRLANRALTLLSNRISGLRLTDLETCQKMFARPVLESIDIRESRFGFEPEITAKVAKGGWRVREVPVPYAPRTRALGKKIGWRDGVRAVYCIIRYNAFE